MFTEVTYNNSDLLDQVAQMHMELLEFGPMAGLGKRFVQEVCYRELLKTGLFRVALYTVDNEPAGFVAFTNKSKDFHKVGMRESFGLVLKESLRAIVTKPARLKSLIESIKVIQTRRHEPEKDSANDGEVICLAVRPQYLTSKFYRETKKRISEDLVVHAANELHKDRVDQMRMIVDEDNKAVLFLYHRLGAEFEPFRLGERPSIIATFSILKLLKQNPAIEIEADCV